jgi:hypothetical protein
MSRGLEARAVIRVSQVFHNTVLLGSLKHALTNEWTSAVGKPVGSVPVRRDLPTAIMA